MKIKAFVVCDAGYLDPAIIALGSFLQFNPRVPVRVYIEKGTSYQRLRRALRGYDVEYMEAEFPALPEHEGVRNHYSDLFFRPEALPAFAQRIKALEELRTEADLIINLDLDTLTRNTIRGALAGTDRGGVYGVNERENRDRWIRSLGVKDITTGPVYINTGFVIYGSDALPSDLFTRYREFLRRNGANLYCPEQDFINYALADRIQELPPAYNLMFTSRNYASTAPVIIHFIGSAKPWTDNVSLNHAARYFFGLYRRTAEKSEDVSPEFIAALRANC